MIEGVQDFGGELPVIGQEVLVVSDPSRRDIMLELGASGDRMWDEYVLPVVFKGGQDFLSGFISSAVEFKCNGERNFFT